MLSDRTLSLEKMARTEKQIWQVLDNMEINCKTMKQQVEKHTEKQVSPYFIKLEGRVYFIRG